jgi:hypothetical protein
MQIFFHFEEHVPAHHKVQALEQDDYAVHSHPSLMAAQGFK